MLITKIKELQLASPAHALDSLDGLAGTLDNSEHDFLKDKLGKPLYAALCQWYTDNQIHDDVETPDTGYYNRLLLLAQRCIAFDALGRAIGTQIVSVHNSGVNIPTADDYEKPRKEDIDTYRLTCQQEAHAALNRLLQTLEEWSQEVAAATAPAVPASTFSAGRCSAAASPEAPAAPVNSEQQEIVTLWRQSRYYYLAAQLLIPSAVILQQYVNFYESREKFIQMLPDLLFIQEEMIAPAIGEDLTAALTTYAIGATVPEDSPEGTAALFTNILHRLRKVMAALLKSRSLVLKYNKEQRVESHDEAVRMFQVATTYIQNHQLDLPPSVMKTSPLYKTQQTQASQSSQQNPTASQNIPAHPSPSQQKDPPACWTPPLL